MKICFDGLSDVHYTYKDRKVLAFSVKTFIKLASCTT